MRLRLAFAVCFVAGCDPSGPTLDGRQQRIVNVLAEDNYMWARREPALVALKLAKMQRGPYEWLRGTASLFWRDVMEPGADRPASAFGDPASSRVLLVGDPHPENIGTYRAADGTMFLDWNDFDATGYGPYTGDLRRLGAGLTIIAGDAALADVLVRNAFTAYAQTMAMLASGAEVGPIGAGRSSLFDDELEKSLERGDMLFAVNELAPVSGTARVLAVGDLEPVADDGVIEDRVAEISAEQRDWIDRAVAQWHVGRLTDAEATVKLVARRIGSGVSSYPALRFNVVLEGATDATTDDRVVEIKETREGIIIDGIPRLLSAEWAHPGARAVDTQRRLQAVTSDPLLGSARVGALSLKIRDRESYQRGINAADLAELAMGDTDDRAQLADIATVYGELLARAHGQAATEDGSLGWQVIAPLLAGRDQAFVDDLTPIALSDAEVIVRDHARMRELDLGSLIIPKDVP